MASHFIPSAVSDVRSPSAFVPSRLRDCRGGQGALPGIQPISPRHRGARTFSIGVRRGLGPTMAVRQKGPHGHRCSLRTPGVVQAAVCDARPARPAMGPGGRGLAGVGSDGPAGVRPAGQPHEPVGVDPRPRARHPVDAGVPALRRTLAGPRVNGLDTWRLEISKSAQLDLFEQLGVPYPRARVINHPSQAPAAARGSAVPDCREAQHRRQRRGHPAIRFARRAPGRRRRRRRRRWAWTTPRSCRSSCQPRADTSPGWRSSSTSCCTRSRSRRRRITASTCARRISARSTTPGAEARRPEPERLRGLPGQAGHAD